MTTDIWAFEAIGTRWEISPSPDLKSRDVASTIIASFDTAYSRFRKDSAVWQLHTNGKATLPNFSRMHKIYRALWQTTAGSINQLVGESLSALGYDADYSLSVGEPVPAPDFENLQVDAEGSTTAPIGTLLDVGAVGKGELIDLVFAALSASGWSGIVDAGGDIRVSEGEMIRVALEHPSDASQAIGVVELSGKAVAASATNRRAWKSVRHIIDARTGIPATEVSATWVIAGTAAYADAIASALFFTTADEIQAAGEFGEFEYVRIFSTGMVEFWLPSGEVFTA